MSAVLKRPITKCFIANRGEIARRIAKSCKNLGIKTVSIIHTQRPPHYLAGLVDEFVYLEDEGAKTFLDSQLMIDTALKCGADAVHPGFGFLSENAGFARAVLQHGLIWIGPDPESIQMMAAKDDARALAASIQVPCVPGLQDLDLANLARVKDQVASFGERVGYPLLIKAALGGGGKGMRLIEQDQQIEAALQRASSEALSSFGNGTLIVEKYLRNPHHVEIQVLGDQFNTIVTLSERDCSLQRRHQKIIEEAPAVGLTEATRHALHNAARRLAERAHYVNAGTVEFLVESTLKESPSEALQPFYFLEMNTRLQVEHPVTEEILRIDLVEWQFRVAQGERIPSSLQNLKPQGHSIEARIYAENPEKDFLPAPGIIEAFRPFQGEGIRWEIGMDGIDEVSARFDPMIAKVIATGDDRTSAINRLASALEHSLILGTANNQNYLLRICRHHEFRKAQPGTSYCDVYHSYLTAKPETSVEGNFLQDACNQAAFKILTGARDKEEQHGKALWRGFAHPKLGQFEYGTVEFFATLASLKGDSCTQLGTMSSPKGSVDVCLYQSPHVDRLTIQWRGQTFSLVLKQKLRREGVSGEVSSFDFCAPVPGKIVRVMTKTGEKVSLNQTVVVIESMKMEFEVKASKAGIIEWINANVGDQVEPDQLLVKLCRT